MEPDLKTVNDYLVSVFNDILTIEESESKKSQFKDLPITGMHTIEAIGMCKKKTTSEVAKELSTTVGTLTTAINKLVRKGYVERIRSEDDHRVVKSGLTKKGKLLFRVHQHSHHEVVKNILGGMATEEQHTLLNALKNLYDSLQNYKRGHLIEQFGMITTTTSVLPEKITTNNDLSKMMGTSDEWIPSGTGIHERRCVTNQETSDLCPLVTEKMMQQKNLNPRDLDFISVATMSPDYSAPSVAAQVQGKLRAANAIAFDISATCPGLVYVLSMAEKMTRCGSTKGLVIGGETLSKLIDWSDRTTAVLFGDGAGGILLEANPQKKLLEEKLAADGTRSTSLTAGYQRNKNPFYSEDSEGSYYLRITDRDIFDFAVRDAVSNTQEVMKDTPVDYLFLHQANLRIIEKIAREIKTPQEKFLTNMDKYGNTSAASIPILLNEAVSSGKVTLGKQQKVVFAGHSGDLTWGSILMRL